MPFAHVVFMQSLILTVSITFSHTYKVHTCKSSKDFLDPGYYCHPIAIHLSQEFNARNGSIPTESPPLAKFLHVFAYNPGMNKTLKVLI